MAGEWKKALEKVPADKRAAVEAAIAEVGELATELDAGYLRQDDYSRKVDAWAAEKKVIQGNWDVAKEQYDDMLEKFKGHEATAAELEQARTDLRTAEGKLTEMKTKAPEIDPTKFITPEQHSAELAKFGAGQVGYFTEALDTVYEMEGLLNQRISPGTLLKEALEAKKTPKAFAEEKYKLAEKREERAKNAAAEHEKKIRDEERSKVVAEFANPATRPLSDSKDAFLPVKSGDTAKQPWEMTETPADEQKILEELTGARVS